MANKRTRAYSRAKWLPHVFLVIASLLFAAPFLWMLSTSFKPESRIFPQPGKPPQWLPTTEKTDESGRRMITCQDQPGVELRVEENGMHVLLVGGKELRVWPEDFDIQQQFGLHWQNYADAFLRMNFLLNLRNTLFICVSCALGCIASSSLVAYSFARIPWRGRNAMFVLVLATMMLPYQVTLIPMFAVFSKLGWVGTFKPLILPAFFGVPFYIFLLRQFFMGIPQDLSAAARIDGCSEFGIFWRIILPLSKPALATTGLFVFLFEWGDFLNPLVYLQDDRQYTLAVALQQFQSAHESLWGPLMAMSTVITLPILILFFLTQKTFIQGITLTGLKG
ncbi:MAG: carbohydrate ABC transporter permease [Candidatus Hydrogenedentes bacterium]|nr:carbohydrate ABC transporter permease [Candidatus Hydrogenedentota bacterium]